MGRVLVVGETTEERRTIVSTLRARHEAHGVGDQGDFEPAMVRARPQVVVVDASLIPIAEGPIADGSVADGPVADGPVADGPLTDGSEAEPDDLIEACRRHGARVLLLCSRPDRTRARLLPVDDHLVRPFSLPQLVARVEALVERPPAPVLAIGDLQIHDSGVRVIRAGQVVGLTGTERKLLLRLASTPGEVVSKRELMAAVWGYEGYPENLVEVHMSALRRRLEALGPRMIVTERGRGYRLG